jgi:hypothetical protein
VLIDGARGYLRSYANSPLGELLPVAWDSSVTMASPKQFALTENWALSPLLNLARGNVDNNQVWGLLPPPHRTVVVRAQPGAETLVELVGNDVRCPALVLRRFGAGQVFYSAFDATWRWRYEVADEFHQRYWNQVGNWIMERPYAVADKFLSLDAAELVQEAGQPASIRARLRDADGRYVTAKKASAVLWKDGRKVDAAELNRDDAGVYRAVTAPLAAGRYQVGVAAEGVPEERSRLRLDLNVLPAESIEMNALAANPALLREMSASSGGEYLEEWEASRLPQLLDEMGSKRVVEHEIRISQSYWWFVPVVVLLALEMMLRKRYGLL